MTGTRHGRRRPARLLLALAAVTVVLSTATACASGDGGSSDGGGGEPSGSPSATESQTPDAAGSPSPTASATPRALVEIPTDCAEMLSEDVLSQLAGTPLNDPAFGESGAQPDGTIVCIWADPAADTTGLTTEITRMNSGPALDMLNALAADEGFNCYSPDAGTRCEKEFPNTQYPVTDGRTLYFRDDVLIDTRYSNLAPTGYTQSIVDHIWP